MVVNAGKPLSILRLLVGIGETSAPYNQFSLALARQHNVTICTYFESTVSVPRQIALFEGNGSLTGFYRALRSALDKRQYDIIHAHSPHVGLLFLLASVFMPRKLLPPTAYTVHNSYPNYKLRNRLMLYPIVACFGRVVCCSKSSLESFPRFLRWLAGDRICAVDNGVDLTRIDRIIENAPEAVGERPFTVVAVGKLIDMKNPSTVLNAYKQASDGHSKLVFIGEGHLRDTLAAEIADSGLEKRVVMTGLIPREEVYACLAKADLCVSASTGEGLPIAILEAMACRCPVILSDIPPHREIAGSADFIPLIQPNDVNGFANEIRRFQTMPSSERSRLGGRCRSLVQERFSLTSMNRGYESIYLQLLGENGR